MPIAQALLPEFDHEMANTRKCIERIPEDKLDWRPHPKSFDFRGLATHLANMPKWTVMTLAEPSFDMQPTGEEPIEEEPIASVAGAVAMFDTNVFGLVDLTNRVVPRMKQQGGGDIVNIASTSGMRGHAYGTAYSASKWAVRGLSQCWQAELRPHDIRVICVCPSEVQTDWGGKTGRNDPNKLFASDISEAILAAISAERLVAAVAEITDILLMGHVGLGDEDQGRDRGCILQSITGNLCWVNNTSCYQIFILFACSIEAVGSFQVFHVLNDN